MTDRSPALSRDPVTKRAVELDALAAILPMDRRDRLAEILTDDDVATLKHLAKEGMGENSLRALASDLAYLEAWVLAATGTPLPWPAPEALAVKISASLSRRSIGRIAAKASSSRARRVSGSRERAGEGSLMGPPRVRARQWFHAGRRRPVCGRESRGPPAR